MQLKVTWYLNAGEKLERACFAGECGAATPALSPALLGEASEEAPSHPRACLAQEDATFAVSFCRSECQ